MIGVMRIEALHAHITTFVVSVVLDQWQNKNMEISDDHYNDWCIAMPC
jgi:hypothetical protein